MEARQREICFYETRNRKQPFSEWLENLGDAKALARIKSGIERLANGNLGDSKSLGWGVHEYRIHFGPGYRIYYANAGKVVLLLLCGGTKRGQGKDIERALSYWRDYLEREEKNG